MNKRNLNIIFILLITLSLLVIISCGACNVEKKDSKVSSEIKSNNLLNSSIFKITISNGGGFTGLSTGYSLFSFGRVDHWRQISMAKDTIIWSVKIDSTQIYKFINEIEESGILNEQLNETGNMTFNFMYGTIDTVYIWNWAGKDVSENNSNEIKKIYSKIKIFCTRLANNNQN